jgi:flagellar hook-associated protein 3 FlgL
MRITGNMISAQQMTSLQANMKLMQDAQERVTTGKSFNAASENPTAATKVMAADSSLRALDQYRTNIQRASSRVNVEDATLQQLGDLLTRARELGISQATDTASDQTRTVANAEVQEIFKQIAELGNTKFGNEYLFGGEQSTTTPFSTSGAGATLDYTSTTPQGQRQVAIGDGQTVAPTHDGKQIFLDTGVMDAVKALSRSLDPSSTTYGQDGIAAALTSLDSAYSAVQTVVGDTGAQANRLSTVTQNLSALKTNLTTFKSDLQDVDIETAMTELTSRQTAYQAALLATSKVTSMSLTDYLR